MKHLQLSPPLLILVMGYPGSGKSFFARQFSEQYGVARVSEDRIRYELFASPTFSKDEDEIIGSMITYMLEQLMQTECPVICDASLLSVKERQQYAQLAHSMGYRTLTVWLQTDAETASQRATKRDKRNPDSKHSFELTPMIFEELKAKLQRPTEKEISVVVSGKHAFKGQCLTVLRKIAAVYSEGLMKKDYDSQPAARPIPTNTQIQKRSRQKYIQ